MNILNDFNTTVEKALTEIDPNWKDYPGLIICGTHTPENIESLLRVIQVAREEGVPFLGICFGHQLAAVEYARNVLGQDGATSEEFGPPSGDFIVKKLPQLKVGLHDGESYWNNYEVIPDFLSQWRVPENFFTSQYHPEYQSSKDRPHPLLVEFLDYARQRR